MMRTLLSFMLGIVLSQFSFAGTINIPTDQSTIQAGIDAALNGDTVLAANGIYTGDRNRDIDFNGKEIVVKSVNGPEFTIIDCEGSSIEHHRGFRFANGESLLSILDGFTVENGYYLGDTNANSVPDC
jgi:hypothetical protein